MNLGERIENKLNLLAEVSKIDDIIWRAAYTPEYEAAKKLIKKWAVESGLDMREDSVGNLYVSIRGKTKETILVASHLDTVRDGGKYDGAAGIICGLVALQELKSEGFSPELNLELVALLEEEGSRFSSSCHGSCAICGTFDFAALDECDRDGVSFREAMTASGYFPEDIGSAKRDDIFSVIELHIEQGPYLEDNGMDIGIVDAIVGIVTYDIVIEGQQNHAGTTPMNMRLDPVTEMAGFVTKVTNKAIALGTPTATFGYIRSFPGMLNVIPNRIEMTLDVRDGDEEILRDFEEKIKSELDLISQKGFKTDVNRTQWSPPVSMNIELGKIIERTCKKLNLNYCHMNSGAGHDSMVFGKKFKTAMIFVPSRDGISHHRDEYTSPAQLEKGCLLLKELLIELATKNTKNII